MAYNESLFQYVSEQLSAFGAFQSKKMFGGMSFTRDGKVFGSIMDDQFYLKVNHTNVEDYKSRGMEQFNPRKNKGMPYWTVPQDVLDNPKELKKWAEKSWKIAIGK